MFECRDFFQKMEAIRILYSFCRLFHSVPVDRKNKFLKNNTFNIELKNVLNLSWVNLKKWWSENSLLWIFVIVKQLLWNGSFQEQSSDFLYYFEEILWNKETPKAPNW